MLLHQTYNQKDADTPLTFPNFLKHCLSVVWLDNILFQIFSQGWISCLQRLTQRPKDR